jgi:hypothetical protein
VLVNVEHYSMGLCLRDCNAEVEPRDESTQVTSRTKTIILSRATDEDLESQRLSAGLTSLTMS